MSYFFPNYKKIKDYVHLQIKSGALQINDQLPSQAELMEMFNVSRGTVHKAISELTEEGVVYGIQGLGNFIANHEADHAVMNTGDGLFKAIAFILPYDFRFTPDLINGIESSLSKRQRRLIVCNSNGNSEREKQLIEQLLAEGIDSFIIYTSFNEKHHKPLVDLQKLNIPFVLVSAFISNFLCDFVVSNNVEGGYQAGSHLSELGHKSIAVFLWTEYIERATVKDRLNGFKKAMDEWQIPFDERHIFGCTNEEFNKRDSNEDVREFYSPMKAPLQRALEQIKDLSAIFCVNDVIALELLRCLDHMGIRVPQEISVIGFDDSAFDTQLSVPLTTIRQEFYSMGHKAGEIVLDKLENLPQMISGVYIPTKLITRSSSMIAISRKMYTRT